MHKNNIKKIIYKQSGFSYVEILISIMIISILSLGIFNLIILSLRISTENQYHVEAINIANQKMERIRNMPYDDVGLISGIPSGLIPPEEIVIQKGTYTVNTYITFFDDPFDGEAGSSNPDTIPVDYKIATIKVSWQSKYGAKNLKIFSKIIPRTEETTAGYGLLKLSVVDANGQPVCGANVNIIDDAAGINVTNPTNSSGLLYLPAPACYQCYKIIVSKLGYGIDQTFPISVENPQPTKTNLSVSESDKTEESFTINKLAVLSIKTMANNLPKNWQVNNSIANEEKIGVKIAIDNTNNIYFSWHNNAIATSTIFLQKYNSSHIKQWATDKKIYENSKFQKNPDLAVAQNGQSFVVWQDNSAALKLLASGISEKKLAGTFFPKNTAIKNDNKKTEEIKNIKKINNIDKLKNFLIEKKTWAKITAKFFNNKFLSCRQTIGLKTNNLLRSVFKNKLQTKIALAGTGTVSFVGGGPGVAQAQQIQLPYPFQSERKTATCY